MANAGTYYVYILASGRHGTPYIGVTNNVRVRLEQHRTGHGSEFIKKYGVHRRSRRNVPLGTRSDRARKAVEELAARLEDSID